MNTSNSAEQLDPFAPDEELGDSKDAQETEKKRKGRMQGYFRISLILGIILWLVDFLILFLDWHSFAALSFLLASYARLESEAFLPRVIAFSRFAEPSRHC